MQDTTRENWAAPIRLPVLFLQVLLRKRWHSDESAVHDSGEQSDDRSPWIGVVPAKASALSLSGTTGHYNAEFRVIFHELSSYKG